MRGCRAARDRHRYGCRVQAAVEIMRAGAADFIERPFTARKLRDTVRTLGGSGEAEAKFQKDKDPDQAL